MHSDVNAPGPYPLTHSGLDDEADFADPLDDDQLRAELRGMGVKATTTLLRISHAFPISQLYATPLCTIST